MFTSILYMNQNGKLRFGALFIFHFWVPISHYVPCKKWNTVSYIKHNLSREAWSFVGNFGRLSSKLLSKYVNSHYHVLSRVTMLVTVLKLSSGKGINPNCGTFLTKQVHISLVPRGNHKNGQHRKFAVTYVHSAIFTVKYKTTSQKTVFVCKNWRAVEKHFSRNILRRWIVQFFSIVKFTLSKFLFRLRKLFHTENCFPAKFICTEEESIFGCFSQTG